MPYIKTEIDTCNLDFTFDIPEENVTAAFAKTFREFGKYMAIPGFRPGKAPRHVVERFADKEKVLDHVREILAPAAFQEMITAEGIKLFDEPEVELGDLVDGQPWRFKAIVPLEPVVNLAAIDDIEVTLPTLTIEESDIDDSIHHMLTEHARVVVVEGRPVKMGDTVISEMSERPVESDETPPMRRKLIRVGQSLPGFDDEIIGQEIGETRTFTVRYPEDHQDQERAGKESEFIVTVQSINESVLPDLTDEWVQATFDHESVSALREAVRTALERSSAERGELAAEQEWVSKLAEKSEIFYPRIMLRREVEGELSEIGERLSKAKTTFEEFLASNRLTEESFHEAMARNAAVRVMSFLIIKTLAQNEGITATRDDMVMEFSRLAATEKWDENTVRQMTRDQSMQAQIANNIIRTKLRAVMLEKVKVNRVQAARDSAEPEVEVAE